MADKNRNFALAMFLSVLIVGLWVWWDNKPRPLPPGQQPSPQATQDQTQEREKQRSEARACLEQATEQLNRDTSLSRDERELQIRWVEYLQRIQAEGRYPNWSGRPCDLYLQRFHRTLQQATATGLAHIEVRGDDLRQVIVTVSVEHTPFGGQTLILPVGTMFTSPSGSTQNMVAASTMRFTFSTATEQGTTTPRELQKRHSEAQFRPAVLRTNRGGGLLRVSTVEPPHSITVKHTVPSFCINRWLHVPETKDAFSISEPDGTSAVGKLIACLESKPEPHEEKQFAVWLLSDNLLDLSASDLAGKLFAEMDRQTPSDPATYAIVLVQRVYLSQHRELPQGEELDKLKEAAESLAVKFVNMPPEGFRDLRREEIRKGAVANVEIFQQAAPMLEECGFDALQKPLLRTQVPH